MNNKSGSERGETCSSKHHICLCDCVPCKTDDCAYCAMPLKYGGKGSMCHEGCQECCECASHLQKLCEEQRGEIQRLNEECVRYASNNCGDRNHIGLGKLMMGAVKLPDATLGQDVAFLAYTIEKIQSQLATQTERERLLERRADSAEELIIQLESGENQHQTGCTKQPPCSCGLDIKRLQWQKDVNKWAKALNQDSLGDGK